MARFVGGAKRDSLDSEDRHPIVGNAESISSSPDPPLAFSAVAGRRRYRSAAGGAGPGLSGPELDKAGRMFRERQF